MTLPLQITVRDIPHTEAVESRIREKAAKLDKFYDHIIRCHVLVESPERRHRKGKMYGVRIHLSVPGDELVVDHEEGEDVYVCVRDAFETARRRLQDWVDRRRGL
jgi:ribosomal subunit interface protein